MTLYFIAKHSGRNSRIVTQFTNRNSNRQNYDIKKPGKIRIETNRDESQLNRIESRIVNCKSWITNRESNRIANRKSWIESNRESNRELQMILPQRHVWGNASNSNPGALVYDCRTQLASKLQALHNRQLCVMSSHRQTSLKLHQPQASKVK